MTDTRSLDEEPPDPTPGSPWSDRGAGSRDDPGGGRDAAQSPRLTLGLSVIMAARDEEEGLERALRRTLAALERHTQTFEIIVVDDGSTDGTGEIAERLAAELAPVRVVRNERNLNYGRSLIRGIGAARCEWILHNGVDLPLDPDDLPLFASALREADVVVVRRTDRSANSTWRTLTSGVNALLLRVLFSPRARDLNFVQFYRRSYAQSVVPVSTGPASVTPELILRAERGGYRVREVEAVFRKRETGRAHFGRPKDILWTLRDMLQLRIRTWLRGWSD